LRYSVCRGFDEPIGQQECTSVDGVPFTKPLADSFNVTRWIGLHLGRLIYVGAILGHPVHAQCLLDRLRVQQSRYQPAFHDMVAHTQDEGFIFYPVPSHEHGEGVPSAKVGIVQVFQVCTYVCLTSKDISDCLSLVAHHHSYLFNAGLHQRSDGIEDQRLPSELQ
jgi:hypothetical protein